MTTNNYFRVKIKLLTNERHKPVVICRVAELLHEGLGLVLGQLLTQVGQQAEQFVSKHGVVLILVVELQDLDEVLGPETEIRILLSNRVTHVEASLVLAALTVDVHGKYLLLGNRLLSLLSGPTYLRYGLQGGVQVAGSHQIASKERINLAVALEVIDVKGEVDGWKASDLGVWLCLGRQSTLGKGKERKVSTIHMP